MSSFDDQSQIKKTMSEKELTDFIEGSLKNYHAEEIVWILNEFLNFSIPFENKQKRSSSRDLRRIKDLSSFNEIKQEFIRLTKNLEDWNHIYLFFNNVKKKANQYEFFKTLREIKDNDRLCSFIYNTANKEKESKNIFEYKDPIYIQLIYNYYTNRNNSDRKNYNIENAILTFNDQINSKNKSLSKNFKNKDFPIWAYSYLKHVDNEFSQIRYIPKNEKNYKNLINAYLDYLAHFDIIFYENLMNKLNKAWSQKKFRDKDKVKKPYHLPLTKKAKEELRKLSAFKDLSESDILEELIHQMFLKEMCDKDGNLKY